VSSPLGRRFRARATATHFAILPTEIPIPKDERNPVPEIRAPGMRWYVCMTAPQNERRAGESLRREHDRLAAWGISPLTPYLPCSTHWRERQRNGQKLPRLEVQTPRIRGYLFVGVVGKLLPEHRDLMAERDLERRNRHGLTAILGTRTGQPIALGADDVSFLARLAQEEVMAADVRVVGQRNFEIGDTVSVADGPFLGYSGPVTGIDDGTGRLLAEIDILGRAVPLELDFKSVERAA
jgi:transcription termination/antitermination protein NusG